MCCVLVWSEWAWESRFNLIQRYELTFSTFCMDAADTKLSAQRFEDSEVDSGEEPLQYANQSWLGFGIVDNLSCYLDPSQCQRPNSKVTYELRSRGAQRECSLRNRGKTARICHWCSQSLFPPSNITLWLIIIALGWHFSGVDSTMFLTPDHGQPPRLVCLPLLLLRRLLYKGHAGALRRYLTTTT